MKGIRVISILRVLGFLVVGKICNRDLVGALQSPLDTGASAGRHKLSSNNQMKGPNHQRWFNSSPPTPSLKVANSPALVQGPAHAAALERASLEASSLLTTESLADNENQRSNRPFTSRREANQSSSSSSSSSSNSSRKASNATNNLTKSLATSYRSPTSTNTKTKKRLEASPPPVPAQTIPKAPSATREKTETSAGTVSKGPVAVAESIEELLALMDGSSNPDDNSNSESDIAALTLVLFHAHYCKICRRATMQLTRAAKEYPSVKFAKVESRVFPEPSAEKLRSIGVTKFPFVHIYRCNGDCVASFSTGPTHMFLRKIRETLDLCLGRDEDSWNDFGRDFSSEIQANRDAREKLGKSKLLP